LNYPSHCIFYNKIYVLRNNEKFQDDELEKIKINKKKKSNNIGVLNSPCKNVDEDKKINHADCGLESLPSTHRYLKSTIII